ncbi:hypothetical protein [Aurantimonas sp. C2-4-R8]|uniref:hypothetical protein n=1 Tax=Aurantimonas sp. C2-4-R8 TaxID=3114364 RepID=UPI002E18892A|nr:hypothetical protein [Aurantimonas sp. C2-3-R2]MEC5410447.1 hypothetical protein [Aurantimonas sp. C2-4-R8]
MDVSVAGNPDDGVHRKDDGLHLFGQQLRRLKLHVHDFLGPFEPLFNALCHSILVPPMIDPYRLKLEQDRP